MASVRARHVMPQLAVLPAMLVMQTGWGPPRVVAPGGEPRAAVQTADGALVLLADTGAATRFTWVSGATSPQRATIAPSAGEDWMVNRRGDALFAGRSSDQAQALAIDASGARVELSVMPTEGRTVDRISADVGEDGTGAIAWTEQLAGVADTDSVVFVRIRPPGGQFGPVVRIPAGGEASDMDLRVRADGLVELLHAGFADHVGRFFHSELRAGQPAPDPAFVATTSEFSPLFPVLGVGRALFGWDTVVSLARTGARTWGPRQRLPSDAFLRRSSLTTLPDGTSVLLYIHGEDVLAARGAPGAPFGAGVRIGHATRGWSVSSADVTSAPAGDLLAVWTEYALHGDLCAESTCFTRVHAAVAAPGAGFGLSVLISGVGTVANGLSSAIGDGGARLVAWTDGDRAIGPNPLVVALGPETSAASRVARRPLTVAVTASRRALRAATHGAPLRVRVRCNQACGVRVMIYSRADSGGDGVFTLPAAVLAHAGTVLTRWRLVRYERDALRQALRAGRLWLPTAAEDRPGHIAYGRARLGR